ncbi:MAG: hypothetical protein OEV74_13690 [Cyclobacteriaceae bacterium]|nr:hypothetical protein [Cyclobacteriaceae bacterium]MDH4297334.1 hypothetical protein [Cyclobacteriaceae bacterium]MDH5250955.1 hypothetical protein [Cyclobacteriaceae bacterium]
MHLWRYLVLLFFLGSCSGRGDKTSGISILWNEEHAISISIPRSYFAHVRPDSITDVFRVHLEGVDQPAILGDVHILDDAVEFEPLIPFTPGLTYDVRLAGASFAKIEIPLADMSDPPVLSAIYPTSDTLPRNLLKIYLEFSRPMQEGQSLKNLVLLKNGMDTVPAVFLDLKPELWNTERTILTLWLDPGRIKRDLQPNQRFGEPLERETAYRLVVVSDWKDTRGIRLKQHNYKDFFVSVRDSLSPDPETWTIGAPAAGTRNALIVDFHERLDAVLCREAIRITDADGNSLSGVIELSAEESIYNFTPEMPWARGTFNLQCEARLEDLAGNNLNRPFDRDLTITADPLLKEIFNRKFQIE